MTNKWLWLVMIIVGVLLVVTGFYIYQNQTRDGVNLPGYITQEECEAATGRECRFVMCDFVPTGKTFEEVCGKGFQKHWEPRQNSQAEEVRNKNVDQDTQSNVYAINKLIVTSGQAVTVKGFVIFATRSCSFKTPQHNPPLGAGGAPCARDSGYVVLSDKPYNKVRTLDPTKNVTKLETSEVLVFYVPDAIVDNVQLGDFYELKGTTTSYNGHLGVLYQK